MPRKRFIELLSWLWRGQLRLYRLLQIVSVVALCVALYPQDIRFDAPYTSSGFDWSTSRLWPVTGVPPPDDLWYAGDPTGALGITTDTFTRTGAALTSFNTPFCPDGGWSDLTDGCMTGLTFNSASYYTASTASKFQNASGDSTVCALVRNNQGTTTWIANGRESSNGEGWSIDTSGATVNINVENHAGTTYTILNAAPTSFTKNYSFICFAYKIGTRSAYAVNGSVAASAAVPSGTIESTQPLVIGSDSAGAYPLDSSGIVFIAQWDSELFTSVATTYKALVHAFTGITDRKGSVATSTNTGSVCGVFDGLLECFGDDLNFVGSEIPPGRATGAGSPASGLYSGLSESNSVTQGDTLSSWTATDGGGAAVLSATAVGTSPYRDGRVVSHIKDDQAGTIEKICSETSTITSLAAADKVQFSAWARDASGTVLDIQVVESGTCVESTTDYAAVTINTTWTEYTWEHAVADTTCTAIKVCFSPADFAAAANTGDADIGAVGVWHNNGAAGGRKYVPLHYCPTAAAAVPCGGTIDGHAIQTGSITVGGVFSSPMYLSFDFAPVVSDNLVVGYPLAIAKDATDYLAVSWGTDETFTLTDGTSHGVSAAYSTIGTFATVGGFADYSGDTYSITLNGTATADTTADTSPTGITTVRIGARTAIGPEWSGGGWIRNVRVRQ